MILYFANRKMEILGHASTHLPEGIAIIDDLKREEVDTGVAVFSATMVYSPMNRKKLEIMTEAGNYLLRSSGDENEFYTIIESEIDTRNQTIYIYAEDAGLDLLNEIEGEFAADKAQTAEWYINKLIEDTGFEIGVNEIPSENTRKLAWTGEATITERIASVATQFDGFEVSYSFEVAGMEITHKYINIHKERGKSVEEQLRLNRDINRIVVKKSVANVATSLKCTGGTPKGKNSPINLNGYKYDDGDFYISGTYLGSRKALEKWSRYVWSKEPNQETGENLGHIVKTFSYDTTSQSELCNRAISELKKLREAEINYEVDIVKLPDNIAIGDRINIVDDAGELYLSARILVLETSQVNKKQTATLGEYLIKTSGISQKVAELASEFSKIAKQTLYTWIAYADDENGNNISLDPMNKKYLGTAVNQTEEEVDISDPSVFTWAKITGDEGITIAITSSNGTLFKDGRIVTTLTAHVYKGGQELFPEDISEMGMMLLWYRDDESYPCNEGPILEIFEGQIESKATFTAKLEG